MEDWVPGNTVHAVNEIRMHWHLGQNRSTKIEYRKDIYLCSNGHAPYFASVRLNVARLPAPRFTIHHHIIIISFLHSMLTFRIDAIKYDFDLGDESRWKIGFFFRPALFPIQFFSHFLASNRPSTEDLRGTWRMWCTFFDRSCFDGMRLDAASHRPPSPTLNALKRFPTKWNILFFDFHVLQFELSVLRSSWFACRPIRLFRHAHSTPIHGFHSQSEATLAEHRYHKFSRKKNKMQKVKNFLLTEKPNEVNMSNGAVSISDLAVLICTGVAVFTRIRQRLRFGQIN